jgi:integral membrane protein
VSGRKYSGRISRTTLRVFQVLAYAEGGLLPTILVVAIIHWVTGYGRLLVALVGATHGMVFTGYILLVPFVARILHWPARTTTVAFSVAFVPFATWTFERRIHEDITQLIQESKR